MIDTVRGAGDRRARIIGQSGLMGSAVVCGVGSVLLVLTSEASLPIILPLLAALGVVGTATVALWDRRGGGLPVFEIGMVYVVVVSLYTVYPFLGFVVNGLRYSPMNDGRLYVAQPRPEELGLIAWYYVAYLACFVAAYVLVRGRASDLGVLSLPVDRPTVFAVIFLYVAVAAFFFFLGLLYNLRAESYAESYLVSRRLPLILAQLANHLAGIRFTLELVLLAAMFANYRRWWPVIAGWLIVQIALAFVHLEGRTAVMLLLLAAAVMYHRIVRPIPLKMAAVASLAGLALFVGLGQLRQGSGYAGGAAGGNPVFGRSSEFEVILANAYDLQRLQERGAVGDLPMAFHFADLLVIPQQLLAFDKVEPATWYVSTFYPEYAATGGAYAFGTIAQSVLGGGWLDVMARGAVLGVLLGLVHRCWARRPSRLWGFVFYVWATVLVYHSFRNTTFSLLGLFLFRFLPAMLAVKVLVELWGKIPRGPRLVTRPGVRRV
jgi:hypothetical protein